MAMLHRQFRPQFADRRAGIIRFDPGRRAALRCIRSLPPEPGRLNAAFAFDRCGRAGQLDFGAGARRERRAQRRRYARAAVSAAGQRKQSKTQARDERPSRSGSGKQQPASDARG
jgi:hypothetical protein